MRDKSLLIPYFVPHKSFGLSLGKAKIATSKATLKAFQIMNFSGCKNELINEMNTFCHIMEYFFFWIISMTVQVLLRLVSNEYNLIKYGLHL